MMREDIAYNKIICFEKNASVKCHHIKRSFIEKGKLILILEDSKKITISGKRIDASGHSSRITNNNFQNECCFFFRIVFIIIVNQ